MLYLLRWVRQCHGFLPDGAIYRAVGLICEILNFAWVRDSALVGSGMDFLRRALFHICPGPGCICHTYPNLRYALFSAWQTIVRRKCAAFSDGRWTTASPAFSFFAIWSLPSLLAGRCMLSTFMEKKLQEASETLGVAALTRSSLTWPRRC